MVQGIIHTKGLLDASVGWVAFNEISRETGVASYVVVFREVVPHKCLLAQAQHSFPFDSFRPIIIEAPNKLVVIKNTSHICLLFLQSTYFQIVEGKI